jgi:surfactin synthase thioesterase subunit
MKEIKLFCLPFAGGNRYSYREFTAKAPSFLKVIPLEYPGRGNRVHEELVTRVEVLVEDLYAQVKNVLDQKEYAFYGHSMGGLLSYLLTRKITGQGHRPPLQLFITGTEGPSAPVKEEKKKHALDKQAFFAELKKFAGIPEEILQDEDLLDFFEPILRADMEATETYVYTRQAPLEIPITVITGSEEDMEPEEIRLWQHETSCQVDFRRMPGNHFFILDHSARLLEIITQKLLTQTITC